MLGLSTSDLVNAGAALIITALLFVTLFKRKPKRAEKREKAEIMKQLIALSEQEDRERAAAAAARSRAQNPAPAKAPNQIRPKTPGKPIAAAAKAR